MKPLLFAVFFLILAATAQAAIYEEQIFSEKLASSGAYTASNGENFTIAFLGDYVNIGLPSGALIVKNDTCEASGIYDVCLMINEFSHYNLTGPERVVNKRSVTIKTRVAKLNLTREIEKMEFWIGDETEARMRIQNIGERPATVSFLDNFSDAFDVALPLTCDARGNMVTWKGELKGNEVVTCNYRIKAEKAGTFSSSAVASYHNGVAEKAETDRKTLNVKDFPLQLRSNISGQSLRLGSEATAGFAINATENMTVKSLKIVLPEGLRLLGWNGISKIGDGTLEYEGALNSGGGHEFAVSFAAEKTGTLPIIETTRLFLTDRRISQEFEREIKVNVSVEGLYARIVKSNFSRGENTLDIFVVNPSNQDFYGVKLAIGTSLPLAKNEAAFSKVSLLGHEEFSEGFDAAPGEYPVTTTLAYSSIYGETFSVVKSENVTVAGEAEAAKALKAPKADTPQESAVPEEPAEEETQKTEFRIEKSEFSAKAAIVATGIVVLIAGILIFISARRKKYEEDEF